MTAEHNNNQRAGEEAQDREGEGGEGNDMEESTDNNQRAGEEAQDIEAEGGGGEGYGTEKSAGC